MKRWRGKARRHSAVAAEPDALARAARVPGMTGAPELRFLYDCARQIRGRGRVVELGSFLGRTTMALAAGIAAAEHPGERLRTIDNHLWEDFSATHFAERALRALTPAQRERLPAEALHPVTGGSFRPLFDAFTEPVASALDAVSADLGSYVWPGDPIELLFIDAAKSWPLLDRIVAQFFPSLLDGAIVIHQDYKHHLTWFIHPVTERMIERGVLEPWQGVPGFATEAFRFRAGVPFTPEDYREATFSAEEIERALADSAARFEPNDALAVQGARLLYLLERGDPTTASRLFCDVLAAGGFTTCFALTAFLRLGSDLHVPLDAALAREPARGRVRRTGAHELELTASRGVAETAARIPAEGASHLLAQAIAPPDARGPQRFGVWVETSEGRLIGHDERALAPGERAVLAAPSAAPEVRVRLAVSARWRVRGRILAPVLGRAPGGWKPPGDRLGATPRR